MMSIYDPQLLTLTGFDVRLAVFLAEASEHAYRDETTFAAWADSTGLVYRGHADVGNVQAYWCSAGEAVLLIYRGTSNIGQWLRDARFIPSKHHWGLVHKGFRNGVCAVREKLAPFYKAAESSRHVWITGHSLGGALAVLTASEVKATGSKTSNIYTYGQPRVGFGNFANRVGIELPGCLHRFVNQSDVVTRVPAGLLYRHCGIVKRIVRPGKLELAPVPLVINAEESFITSSRVSPASTDFISPAQAILEGAALESAATEAKLRQTTLIDTDVVPLSEKEFEELQLALGAAAETPQLESALLEGAFPWIKDHACTEYIRLLAEIRDQGT